MLSPSDIALATASTPRVAQHAQAIVAAAQKHAAPDLNLTPEALALDLAAIVMRESGGRNVIGDHGHGHGLGQIDDRSWGTWLAANLGGMDPASNLDKSAEIYVRYLRQVAAVESSRGVTWPPEVIRRTAIAAYNCGPARALQQLHAGLEHLDDVTTGRDYSADVWRRRQLYADALNASRHLDCA